jgi:macrolide transport system ATP-binding/permease protein
MAEADDSDGIDSGSRWSWWRKSLSIFRRKRSANDFAEEIQAHLELEADELKAEGLSEVEAYRKARVGFGNMQIAQERFYLKNRVEWFDEFIRNVTFAIRQHARHPNFAVTAILVLALGMGASVAIFAFVDAALIKPLPYTEPRRLVHVTESDSALPRVNLSYLDYTDWKRMNTVLSSLDAFTGWSLLLSTPTGAEPLQGERVSAGFFRTLGVTPALGRDFYANEEAAGGPRVVMLSYEIWQRRFGSRANALGESVYLNGVPYTIVGVLPKFFAFAPGRNVEFWTAMQPDNECDKQRDCHYLYAIGRLKDGLSVQTASANMKSIARQLETQYPDSNRGRGASVTPLSERIVGDVRPILLLLLSGSGLLLLLACVNLSSLLVVQSETRKHEMAVRGALGASRARIAYQFAVEGVVLVICGALIGLGFAVGTMQILTGLISKQMIASMPYLDGLGLNTHVLLFTAIQVLLVSVLFSLVPFLHLLSSDIRGGLTEGFRTSAGPVWRRMGGRLVVIELVITMVLLTGAGLLSKSLYRLLHVDVGFQSDHLATLHIRLPETVFPGNPEQVAFTRKLLDRVNSLPRVRASAVTSLLPVSCNCYTDWIRFVGRPYKGSHLTVNVRVVSAGYFNILHTPLVAGRYFSDTDDTGKPRVMLINRAFAQKYFPGEDPVGKQVGDPSLSPQSMKRIVGEVEDLKDASLDDEQRPAAYYPYNQDARSTFYLTVRTAQDDHAILPTLVAAIHELNVNVGVEEESTMSEQINNSKTAYFHRSAAYLVGGFAVLALILSSVGLYGVIAYSVSRRTREIGVRMALGAQRGTVLRMVLGEACELTVAGAAIGIIVSLVVNTLLRKLLFRVDPFDLPTLTAVAIILAVATFLASYIPAHRAASSNPVEALRSE